LRSTNQTTFDLRDSRSRLTVILTIDFLDLLLMGATPAFRSFLEGILCLKLGTILNYFIEYDLDTKGISSLSYFLEEEFKDKFES
jgi:hypothetical protein